METIKLSILEEIISIVAQITGVSVEDIKSKARRVEICDARQMFIVYMASQNDVTYSLSEIAAFVNMSHAMVLYAKTQVQNKRDTEKPFDQTYQNICKTIAESSEIKRLIASHRHLSSREPMTAPELGEAILLIKERIEQLSGWLVKYVTNPYRAEIQRDKRRLEIELKAKEEQLTSLT